MVLRSTDNLQDETITGSDFNEDTLDLQPRGAFGEQGPACPDNNGTGTVCASKAINIPRLSRLLLIGTATAQPVVFDDVTGSNAGADLTHRSMSGDCFLRVDGAQTGNGTAVYQGAAPPCLPSSGSRWC